MSGELMVNPQNLEAERALIGACLCDREVLPVVAQIVRPTDFYAHVHEWIFATLLALHEAGKPLDKITVAEELRNRGQLDKVGGISYFSTLMDTVQTVSSAEYYAKIIREKAVLNRLLRAGESIRRIALDGECDVEAAIADAEKALSQAIDGYDSEKSGGHISTLLRRVWEQIDAAQRGAIVAQDTPWSVLDAITGGWFGGEFVLWAGRPKDGKSTAVVQVVEHVAKRYGPVILFALEMGEDSVVRRLLGKHSGISSRKIRRGQLMPSDFERLGSAMGHLSEQPIYIYSSARSISEMRRTALAINAKTPVKAIIVDHVGFLSDVLESREKEHDALNKAYLRLINLAKELDCVVHGVQHVNRDAYDREPTMKSIRGGGNPEGHAHTIVAPFRPNPDENPQDGKFLIIANREGVQNTAIEMQFDGAAGVWRQVGALGGVA